MAGSSSGSTALPGDGVGGGRTIQAVFQAALSLASISLTVNRMPPVPSGPGLAVRTTALTQSMSSSVAPVAKAKKRFEAPACAHPLAPAPVFQADMRTYFSEEQRTQLRPDPAGEDGTGEHGDLGRSAGWGLVPGPEQAVGQPASGLLLIGDFGGVWVKVLHQEGEGNCGADVDWRLLLDREAERPVRDKRHWDAHDGRRYGDALLAIGRWLEVWGTMSSWSPSSL